MLFVAPEKSIHHGFSWFNLTKLRESDLWQGASEIASKFLPEWRWSKDVSSAVFVPDESRQFRKGRFIIPMFFPRRGVLAGAVTAASCHRKFSGSNVAVWPLDHNESHKHGTAKCIADEEFVGHLGCWCVSLVCLVQVEKFAALATWKALYVAIARRVSKIYCWSTEVRGGVGIFFRHIFQFATETLQ